MAISYPTQGVKYEPSDVREDSRTIWLHPCRTHPSWEIVSLPPGCKEVIGHDCFVAATKGEELKLSCMLLTCAVYWMQALSTIHQAYPSVSVRLKMSWQSVIPRLKHQQSRRQGTRCIKVAGPCGTLSTGFSRGIRCSEGAAEAHEPGVQHLCVKSRWLNEGRCCEAVIMIDEYASVEVVLSVPCHRCTFYRPRHIDSCTEGTPLPQVLSCTPSGA